MNRLVTALMIFVPALALAAPAKPLPASEHTPPLILDETSVTLDAYTFSDNKKGYSIKAYVAMLGFATGTDRARIDLKKGGKVFATVPCDLRIDGSYAHGECEFKDKPLTPIGEVEGDLIYTDDKSEQDYLVRTFRMTIVHLVGQYDAWSIVPDDVLAAGWMVLGHENSGNDELRRPDLYLWVSSGESLPKPVLRCVVGTKKIPDIGLSESGGGQEITIDHQPKSGPATLLTWRRLALMPRVFWGKRETLENRTAEPDMVFSDNPGKWECSMRNGGKTLRLLNFTVNADGMVEQDEMQSGKSPVPVFSDRVVLIDLRLGKDAASFDKRINPDAMKRSMGFGLPWPDHRRVKEIQSSFPPKSGVELR